VSILQHLPACGIVAQVTQDSRTSTSISSRYNTNLRMSPSGSFGSLPYRGAVNLLYINLFTLSQQRVRRKTSTNNKYNTSVSTALLMEITTTHCSRCFPKPQRMDATSKSQAKRQSYPKLLPASCLQRSKCMTTRHVQVTLQCTDICLCSGSVML
jgi:hypothetical protein